MSLAGTALFMLLAVPGSPEGADPEKLKTAKTLYFDRKYAEAREAWIRAGSVPEAAYWIARCSEGLGEDERALAEYSTFLSHRPADRELEEEALTSRIGVAAKLVRAGKASYLSVLDQGLSDSRKTVRYYAAFARAGLGREQGLPAVPVLKTILRDEHDPDLVDRAQLYLLRLDPGSLASPAPQVAPRPTRSPPPGGTPAPVSWVKVRVYGKGSSRPEVSINMPLSLAGLLFRSLPDEAREELRRKGYDADNFWERLKKMGPAQIVSIEGDDGTKVQIWLE